MTKEKGTINVVHFPEDVQGSVLFSKDALNSLNMTVKLFTKDLIQIKCCFFYLLFIKKILKKKKKSSTTVFNIDNNKKCFLSK